MKRCPRCGATKALDEFPIDKRAPTGRYGYCKPCKSNAERERRSRDRDRVNALARARYVPRSRPATPTADLTPEQREARRRRQADYQFRKMLGRFGLTEQDWQDMVDRQGDRCAVCSCASPGRRGRWHLDHDHKTGVVRGLLCQHCNLGLGQFRDDPVRLAAAIEYLTVDRMPS